MPISQADRQVADGIVGELAETFGVTVVTDWGELLSETGALSWQGGEWSLEELRTLQKGIVDLATAMGGAPNFSRNLGNISINQVDIKYRGLASSRGVKFTTSPISIDVWTVVHELAHVWDARFGWRLSRLLERYTGGRTNLLAMALRRVRGECDSEGRMPGCNRFGYFYGDIPPAGSDQNFNRKEDFAESVTAYVYPAMVQARVDRFKDDARYRALLYYPDYTQTRRWAFVDGLIKGTISVD